MIDNHVFDRRNGIIEKQTTFSEKIANLFKSRTNMQDKANSVENKPRKSAPMLVTSMRDKRVVMTSASYEDTESPKNDAKPNIMIMALKN